MNLFLGEKQSLFATPQKINILNPKSWRFGSDVLPSWGPKSLIPQGSSDVRTKDLQLPNILNIKAWGVPKTLGTKWVNHRKKSC